MRIAIVNDLRLAREALRRVVQAVPGAEVAWTAGDGIEAVERARSDRPDLILMDLIMPGIDGAEATRRVMAEAPCPILVVTSSVAGNIAQVYEAMGHGALDAVDTPCLGAGGALEGAGPLLRKIETVRRRCAPARGNPAEPVAPPVAPAPRPARGAAPLVLLGASTGGPKALAQVLGALPAELPAAVIVVQHVDEAFAPGLVRWLGESSRLPVEAIADGAAPRPGRVLVARTNDHLVLTSEGRLAYTPEPAAQPYRPSVDVFFGSVARHWPEPGVAALLTGMGRDGAEGLRTLRCAGWLTLAQDQDSCVVHGMPRAAVELGAAVQVLPPAGIAEAIAARLRARASL